MCIQWLLQREVASRLQFYKSLILILSFNFLSYSSKKSVALPTHHHHHVGPCVSALAAMFLYIPFTFVTNISAMFVQ